jgi:uncharacterized protein YjdB
MKTLITYRLLMALLLPVWLSAQTIQMSIPDTTGVRGVTILIPIRIDNSITGSDVTSYQLSIQFSDYVLAVDSAVLAETMTQTAGMSLYFSKPQSNTVTIAAAGSTPLQGVGVLIYLRFKIVHSGYTAISFTDASHNLLNEGTPAALLVNGSISASEPPTIWVYPNNEVLSVGERLQFSVNGATDPLHWSVTDTSVASIDSMGLLTASNRGTTRVVATDGKGIIDTTDGIIEVRALKLVVPDTVTVVGRLLDIPIYCSSLSGLGIVAGEITLAFDGDIITPLALIKTGTLLQTYPDPGINTTIKGRVNIAFAGDTPLSGSGILCYVRFNVTVNGGRTDLDFSGALFNEIIPAKVDNGSVTSQTLTTLDILPRTAELIVGDTLRFTINNGTAPYTWTVTDPTIATIDANGLLTALKSGSIHVTVHDALGFTGTTDELHIFNVITTIDKVFAPQGALVDVPIIIHRFNGGPDVFAFQISAVYDTSLMKAVSIINAGTLSEGWSSAPNISGNRIIFASAGNTGFHTIGTLVIFRFQVGGTTPYDSRISIQMNQLLLNEGSPSVLTMDGGVTVVAPPAQPALYLPNDGSTDQPSNITLQWYSSYEAQTYRLQVSRTSAFTQIVIDDSTRTATTCQLSGLVNGVYYWRVSASNVAGTSAWSSAWSFTVGPPTGVEKNSEVPKQFTLGQNYPNPFNPVTTIIYTLSKDDWVTLKVFDILGREIKILVNGIKRAGITYQVEFNASKLPSGIYLYRLQTGEKSLVKKLTIMK